MKRPTKFQKLANHARVYHCVKNGQPVTRDMAKDGSIPTHPIVPVHDLPESEVLRQCLAWLKKHRIFCNRLNSGGGVVSSSGYRSYGIKGAGDIIGLTSRGIHLEIECKAGSGGRLSKEQQERQEKIQENMGLYFVVHGVAELEYYCKCNGAI